MKSLTLTTSNIDRLNSIQKRLSKNKPISEIQKKYLSRFLKQIPTALSTVTNEVSLNEIFDVKIWDTTALEITLGNWKKLFNNIPGYDYVSCWLVPNKDVELLDQNVIMTACFAPTMSYNASHLPAYYVHLKDDGTASFKLPTLEDAEHYCELYNFRGTWKEAYLLLIETLKKGWPTKEFPEELRQFLKKE